jgi:hypothetical protein
MADELHGRVIITWPAASPRSGALPALGISVTDADTGENILDAFALRLSMDLGTDQEWTGGPITVTLTRIVHPDGTPIGGGPGAFTTDVLTDEYAEWQARHMADGDPTALFPGQKFRTGEFRYLVAEMRVAEAK